MKLNTKQKRYLKNIVNKCSNSVDFRTMYYDRLEEHEDMVESLSRRPHEDTCGEMERFISDLYYDKIIK